MSNIEFEIQKVSEKVDSHHKSSIEFYTEMRVGYQAIQTKLTSLEKSVMYTDLKLEDFEKRFLKSETKQEKIDKVIIWISSGCIFLLFLILILFSK